MDKATFFSFFPIGSILPLAGLPSDMPAGWFVCDGTNNTVDLVRKPAVGLGTKESITLIGTSVGVETHAHTFTQGQVTPFNSGSGRTQPGQNSGFDAASNPHNHPLNGVTTDPCPNLPLSTLIFYMQKTQ